MTIETAILGPLFWILYFFPGILGLFRDHKNKAPVFLLNLFLGWTVIGWIGALIWATMKQPKEIK